MQTRTLDEVIEEFEYKSYTGHPGRMGNEVVVEKTLLKDALVYLEDYKAILEGDI